MRDHRIADAGEHRDVQRNTTLRVDKCFIASGYRFAIEQNNGDLGNGAVGRRTARGFYIYNSVFQEDDF